MTTQNCAECDTRAEPGQSFCDACGAVLRWDAAGARSGGSGGASAAASGSGGASGAGAAGGFGAASGPGSHSGSAADSGSASGPAAGSGPAPGWDAFSRPGGTGAGPTGAPRTAFAPEPSPASPDLTDTTPNTPVHPAPDDFPPTTPAPPHAPSAPHSFTSPPPPTPSAPPAPPTPPVPDDRARSLLVPVADPEPTPPAPSPAVAPVLPGRPEAARPQVRAPGHQHQAGQGPPCPWCATPNRPDRHFCGHCAMPLADGAVRTNTPVHLPWWRRLFGPGQNEAPWAGDRPRLRRVFDRIGTWVTAVVVVTLLILGAVYIPDGYQATRDHFAKRAPVEPDQIRTSRSYAGHPPKLAFDKLNNTWWGPGVARSGQGEWIEVRFARPTRLLDLIITPGVSTRADQLDKSALPHRVKATITKKDGSTATRELTLDPGAGGQRRAFRVGEVTKVRFTIVSAHAASAKKQVAISEIEMFGRSDGSRT